MDLFVNKNHMGMIISRKHTKHLIAYATQVLVRKIRAFNMGNLYTGKSHRSEFTIQPHGPH